MPEKSVSFAPDEGFKAKIKSGEGSSSTIKGFLQEYEDLKNEHIQVGHVGLYWDDEGEAHLGDKDGTDTLINSCLELGASGKGKLLVMCEEGLANAARELADDEDNHLPFTKTGVVIHYLTEGIARDFGITFDRQPVSLGGGRGKGGNKNDREAGVIRISKQEKNELLEKLDITYYQQDIASGKISMQDAFSMIEEQLKKKMEWEEQGYYLSPNKTEGVLLYDWKSIINKSWGDKNPNNDATWFYGREKVEVVIPDLFNNYYVDGHSKANKKNTSHLLKSILGTTVVRDANKFGIPGWSNGGLYTDNEITCEKDILDLIEFDKKGTVMGVHLAKLKKPGMMKPRYVVVDVLDGKEQILYLYDKKQCLTLNRKG